METQRERKTYHGDKCLWIGSPALTDRRFLSFSQAGKVPPVPSEEELKALAPVPPKDVKFDEKTGAVTFKYEDDYKG